MGHAKSCIDNKLREASTMPRTRYPVPPSSEITPPEVYAGRRQFMAMAGGLLAGVALPGLASASPSAGMGRFADLPRSPLSTSEPLTEADVAGSYNNFFEFGTGKEDPRIWAHRLRPDPWSVEIDGLVARPAVYQLEDILRGQPLEERIYRLRCVEAWSMVIPWIGFPLADLIKRVEPMSDARYVMFETLHDPKQMPGQRRSSIPWPYREGLRMDEAMHPLTLLAVGMYGDTMPNQHGAPLRLVVPWKYGFKSIKSIVRIHFQAEQPLGTWEALQPREYGFHANVNPSVRHPRWSQATERRVGQRGRIPTQMFNGYAEQVAHLYSDLDLTRFF